jgi:WhiB family transcriptional regulator, redox-sensing transcriptional regulator
MTMGFSATTSRKGASVVAIKDVARVNHKIPPIDEVLPVDLRNCYGMDPDLFTGYDGETTEDRVFRETDAKAVCAGCALVNACLAWAQDHGERGVWGGTNDDDRREIRTGKPARSHAAQDPEGLTKQKRARKDRIKIATNLKAQGIGLDDIAREIGVTRGTIYDYFRFERKTDHEGRTDPRPTEEAQADEPRSPNAIRPETPVLDHQVAS